MTNIVINVNSRPSVSRFTDSQVRLRSRDNWSDAAREAAAKARAAHAHHLNKAEEHSAAHDKLDKSQPAQAAKAKEHASAAAAHKVAAYQYKKAVDQHDQGEHNHPYTVDAVKHAEKEGKKADKKSSVANGSGDQSSSKPLTAAQRAERMLKENNAAKKL